MPDTRDETREHLAEVLDLLRRHAHGIFPLETREDLYHGFCSFQSRGVLRFPAELRDRLCTEVPGAQLEVTEIEPGVFVIRPVLPVPADQQWFWTQRWQAMEREADADVAAGRVARFDDVEDFLADLDA